MSDDKSRFSFSAEQARDLSSVLDEIIPPSADGKLPGAGELGLVEYLEGALQRMSDLQAMIIEGLAALDELARSRNAAYFAALCKEDKVALLNEQGFVFPLMFQTYIGYYQSARVVQALGLEARPPHPKGYEIGASDLTLLDGVVRRRKLYREC